MDKKIISAVVITVVVAGGIGFYGGLKYQQNKFNKGAFGSMLQGQRQSGGQNVMRRQTGGQNMAFLNGEILSKDDKSVTVKLRDGGSKIVFYSQSTTIGRMATGTIDSLGVGEQVMVNGINNSDGSISAQAIQVRPDMPQGFGRAPGN